MSARSLIGPALLIGCWSAVVWSGWISPILVPGPWAVVTELGRMLGRDLALDLGSTVGRVLAGVALGAALGVPIGLLVGSWRWAEVLVGLPVDLYRSLPAIALVPLFVIVLGVGEVSRLAMAVGAVLPITLVSASYGARSVREGRRALAKGLGMTQWQRLRLVVLPESLPHIFGGLRLAMSAATTVVIAAEMLIGANHGLGRRIADAQLFFRIPELYATVLLAAALGYGLNLLVLVVEHRALHWVGR